MTSGSWGRSAESSDARSVVAGKAALRPVLALALAGLVTTLPAAGAFAADAAVDPHPRARLFPHSSAVTAKLAEGSADRRLTVVFVPQSWACNLANATAARVVDRLAKRYAADTATLYVIPTEWRGPLPFHSERLGETVEVPQAVLAEEHRTVPLPRLEIWTSDGELLLLRSLDKFEEDALYEELESSRTFLAKRP